MKDFYIEKGEAVEIVISVLAISFAFTILFTGGLGTLFSLPKEFLVFMLLSLVTIGSGFVLHEMGHKLVAIYFGASARFQMWLQGLAFMLVTSLFGILIAAPGAVVIYGQRITRAQNGLISLAGPAVNLLVMLVFLGLSIVAPRHIYFSFDTGFLRPLFANGVFEVWWFGAYLNFVLCMFNMIPAFPLDGSKVFFWSKPAWFAFMLSMFVFGVGIGLVSVFFAVSWMFMLLLVSLVSMLLFRQVR
jgi:Zn-dependent protease